MGPLRAHFAQNCSLIEILSRGLDPAGISGNWIFEHDVFSVQKNSQRFSIFSIMIMESSSCLRICVRDIGNLIGWLVI